MQILDSGERKKYETGAVRDNSKGKGRFDLISPEFLFRISKWLELGAIKYDDRNWEKGIPISRCIDSAFRHLTQYLAGYDDEDHLAAAAINIMFIIHYEKYKPEMQDLPLRRKYDEKQTKDVS